MEYLNLACAGKHARDRRRNFRVKGRGKTKVAWGNFVRTRIFVLIMSCREDEKIAIESTKMPFYVNTILNSFVPSVFYVITNIFLQRNFYHLASIAYCNNLYRNFVGNKNKPCNEEKKASRLRLEEDFARSPFPLSVHKINNPVFLNVLACATRRKEKFPEELDREVASATVK